MAKKKEAQEGLVAQLDGGTVEIKYSADSTEKGLIKFTPKGKDFEISADDLLSIIRDNFAEKELAIALTDTTVNKIFMVDVIRQFNFEALQDYKKGDVVSIKAFQPYPYVLAALEEAYNKCKISGEVEAIEVSKFTEALEGLKKRNEDFVKTLNKLNDK